jgi:hypothetical protein
MALLFIDGFDHMGTSGGTVLPKKWDAPTSGGSIINTPVRTGAAAMQVGLSGTGKLMLAGDVFIFGCAIRFGTALPTTGGLISFLAFYEGGGSLQHIGLNLNSSGFLLVRRGGITTLATATSHAMVLDTWYYLEIKVVIHDTAGSVEVHVDGAPVTFGSSLTGIDTRNGGLGFSDQVWFDAASGVAVFVDDVYCCDDSGTVNNSFLGVCSVETLLSETGNGTHANFTPSTGTDHGALVDDNPPNDDTDYNVSFTVGHRDSYNYPASASAAAILGIQTNLYVRKTDLGIRTAAALVRTGGTTYTGAAMAMTTAYKYLSECRDLNPQTGLTWTAADVAALEAGIEVAS